MGNLKQEYDVRIFQGKHAEIEIRVWRNGNCSGRVKEDMQVIQWQDLVESVPVMERRINDLLLLATGKAADEDVQVIKDAMSDLYQSKWIAEE